MMFPAKIIITEMLTRKIARVQPTWLFRYLHPSIVRFDRGKKTHDKKGDSLNSLIRPVRVQSNPDDINVGAEISGVLKKADLQKVLATFFQRQEVHHLTKEYGLTDELRLHAYNSFRRYCLEAENLPVDLHVVFSDILQGAGHATDIFPYFIRHAKEIYPHLDCMDELKKISDLRSPANWYPMARAKTRKIIFHAGPTNSGKTYHALERLRTAKSGIYCGPLKLLATEVYRKMNQLETPFDLVTGEEVLFAKDQNHPADHIACTVEMARLNIPCEVGVIDEIQLLKDSSRGWAWTRALLGLPVDELHLCGEEGAVDLVRAVCSTTGEDVEIRRYKRLTELEIQKTALTTLRNVQPGDCIVCFSKNDIYTVSRKLEQLKMEVAVIYGGLPPNTKLSQAAKFNDPNHSCKVMVATDAIGMGLNLHIKRIIFYSLIRPILNEKGEKEMDTISVSSALQIAGRAGRYGTQFSKGYVTTFKPEDLTLLQNLLSQTPDPITQAGLHPTADQIELYSYHLPKAALSNLMDIFMSLSTVDDSLYFMCNVEDFKFLADMIQHVPLPLRARYVFCCAPINKKVPFPCTMFLKFARQYARNEPITFTWLCQQIGWPLQPPKTILDLVHLEVVFDVLDLYLWLSYRFMDLFPDGQTVRDVQKELDAIIQDGIIQLTKLLGNSETGASSVAGVVHDEDDFQLNTQKQQYFRDNRRPSVGRGKLTERLLSQGLLTPNMLQELQREWSDEKNESSDRKNRNDKYDRSKKPK